MKKLIWRLFVVLLVVQIFGAIPLLANEQEGVVLLHGGLGSSRSMRAMERELTKAGYKVYNVDYPSTKFPIEQLGEIFVGKAVADCERDGLKKINFATFSMGGIVLRSYLAHHSVPTLGRVVMLGPPNQGSEIADNLLFSWIFKKLSGPAVLELGTGTNSTPNKLGPANFCLGVIAGNWTVNWINSLLLIPGSDDGRVPVARTKLVGMTDHIVLPVTHPFMAKNKTAIRQAVYFLKNGRFYR